MAVSCARKDQTRPSIEIGRAPVRCHVTRWGPMLIRWQRFFSEDAMANPISRNPAVVARFIAAILFGCVCCVGTQSIADGQFHKRAHRHK